MGDTTSIEWTDATWTPIRARINEIQSDGGGKLRTGWHCEHVSEGCRHCYAEAINRRLGTGLDFKPANLFREVNVGYGNGEAKLFLDEKMLLAPLRWTKPRMIFVCSMSDLFADFVPEEWIDRMFAVMALAPQHTFQVLTKRPERMLKYMSPTTDLPILGRLPLERVHLAAAALAETGPLEALKRYGNLYSLYCSVPWPLPNVWLGTSVENQDTADERIPHLLSTPAAVRFLSCEPLLGPVDLTAIAGEIGVGLHSYDALRGHNIHHDDGDLWTKSARIHWVIAGGESGPGARPMSIQWPRSLRDQCAAAGVPFFFKQWGEWAPTGGHQSGTPGSFAFGDYEHDPSLMVQVDSYPRQFTKFGARSTVERVGKKAAGALLDGREHRAMPQVRS